MSQRTLFNFTEKQINDHKDKRLCLYREYRLNIVILTKEYNYKVFMLTIIRCLCLIIQNDKNFYRGSVYKTLCLYTIDKYIPSLKGQTPILYKYR